MAVFVDGCPFLFTYIKELKSFEYADVDVMMMSFEYAADDVWWWAFSDIGVEYCKVLYLVTVYLTFFEVLLYLAFSVFYFIHASYPMR